MVSQAIGIDFGTSNSTVGFSYKGKPNLIELEEGKSTIPSAIFYDIEENQTLFGRKAISAYINHYEGRLLRSLKSILGSSLIDETTQIGNKRISFKEIIGEFLGHLKTTTEKQLGRTIDSVVLGRPVWFVDGDNQADLAAQKQLENVALSNGFKHIHFQYEPIAAALDYEQLVTSEELALIVDIGGGTSDFSIIKLSPKRRRNPDRKSDILANTGVHIGGNDIDKKLSINEIMPFLGYKTQIKNKPELLLPNSPFHDLATWHKIIFLYNNKAMSKLNELLVNAACPELVERLIKIVKYRNGHRLAGDVEVAKMALSNQENTKLELNYVESGLETILKRKAFEKAISPEREKIIKQINECLLQANISATQINTLFLTGGSTAIPSILAECQETVPNAKIVKGNQLGSVGTGLAIDASIKFAE